jgi:hypothetical protein
VTVEFRDSTSKATGSLSSEPKRQPDLPPRLMVQQIPADAVAMGMVSNTPSGDANFPRIDSKIIVGLIAQLGDRLSSTTASSRRQCCLRLMPKLHRRTSEVTLKGEFADMLPPENAKRGKMDFAAPVGRWSRDH